MSEVTRCASCSDPDFYTILDMGVQPLAEGGEGEFPLKLIRCTGCSLVQLSYIPDQANIFRPEHPYSTGNTEALVRHFRELGESLRPSYFGELMVVDIGANDGTLLNMLPGRYKRIAVEPTDQILKAPKDIIPFREFFSYDLAKRIKAAHGPADIITATNVLAHVPSLDDFLYGVHELLADDGEFITENHDFYSITEGAQYDTVYHEHLRYYTLGTLARILETHGFRVVSSQSVPTHGGSFRVTAKKVRGDFPKNIQKAATDLNTLLNKLTLTGQIYGIGATTRATPLIHYSGIAPYITLVCEVPQSDKIGTCIPGTDIKVRDEKLLIENQPEYALLLSYHLADTIIPKLRERGYKGKFIVPVPEVKIYNG